MGEMCMPLSTNGSSGEKGLGTSIFRETLGSRIIGTKLGKKTATVFWICDGSWEQHLVRVILRLEVGGAGEDSN